MVTTAILYDFISTLVEDQRPQKINSSKKTLETLLRKCLLDSEKFKKHRYIQEIREETRKDGIIKLQIKEWRPKQEEEKKEGEEEREDDDDDEEEGEEEEEEEYLEDDDWDKEIQDYIELFK